MNNNGNAYGLSILALPKTPTVILTTIMMVVILMKIIIHQIKMLYKNILIKHFLVLVLMQILLHHVKRMKIMIVNLMKILMNGYLIYNILKHLEVIQIIVLHLKLKYLFHQVKILFQ